MNKGIIKYKILIVHVQLSIQKKPLKYLYFLDLDLVKIKLPLTWFYLFYNSCIFSSIYLEVDG